MRGGWALGAVVCLLLAGCAAPAPGCVPPVSPGIVPADAPAEAGDGARSIRIAVTHADTGAAVPGAAVVLLYNRDPIDRNDPPNAPPLVALLLRTGPDGAAIAHVAADRYTVAIAQAPGTTEEWTGLRDPGAGNVALTVYSTNLTVSSDETLAAPGHPGAGGGVIDDWSPRDIRFGPAGAQSGYRTRIVHLELRMEWTLELPQQGSLALAASKGADVPDKASARAPIPTMPGAYNQSLVLDEAALFDDVDRHEGGELRAGPQYPDGYVAPTGLPVHLVAAGRFDTRSWMGRACGYLYPDSPVTPWEPSPEGAASSTGAPTTGVSGSRSGPAPAAGAGPGAGQQGAPQGFTTADGSSRARPDESRAPVGATAAEASVGFLAVLALVALAILVAVLVVRSRRRLP